MFDGRGGQGVSTPGLTSDVVAEVTPLACDVMASREDQREGDHPELTPMEVSEWVL